MRSLIRSCVASDSGCQGQMISQDKLEKERMDCKNAVEEYVYETREKLSGQLEGFIKEKVCVKTASHIMWGMQVPYLFGSLKKNYFWGEMLFISVTLLFGRRRAY